VPVGELVAIQHKHKLNNAYLQLLQLQIPLNNSNHYPRIPDMQRIAVPDTELTPQTPYPLATVQSQWASLTDRYIWHADNPDQFFTMQGDLRRMIIQCF